MIGDQMNDNNINIKNTLEQSCDDLKPTIEQQLNARRNLALREPTRRSWLKFAMTAVPLTLVFALWIQYPEQHLSQEQAAFYNDIDYLLEEEEMDFLADMDVSNWLSEIDEANESG